MDKELYNFSNILIVTIDPDISSVLSILLNNLNYKIELTNSGAEAISQLKHGKFDLMLLDTVLPDMSAVQILNSVSKISPATFVITMSNEISADKLGECYKNGAHDHLSKPFGNEEIQIRIRNALEQRKIKRELESIENSAQISEKRNYFIQNADDIFYTLDYEGKFTSINNSLQTKLGFDSSFLLRKHYTSVIYPEDIQKALYVFNERRALTRDLKPVKIRLRKNPEKFHNNCSKYITVEVRARGIYDKRTDRNDKLFLGTYGIATDISDLIKNEEVLKLQKVYFKELFNNSTSAGVLLDPDSKILNTNKSFESLFKYSLREIKNNSINDYILPKNMTQEAGFDRSVTSIAPAKKESVRKSKNGKLVSAKVGVYPVVYNNKNIGIFQIFRDITNEKLHEENMKEDLVQTRKSMGRVVDAMVSTAEVRDPYTVGHQQRVSNIARAIAKEMNLGKDEIDAIRMSGNMHDLGKVNIPAEILSKPGKLSSIEFDLIKMHPTIAYQILKKIEFPWYIADIVHQHHERMDGSGYPQGLKGNKILLSSRILSVADVVESISSHRPYRPALGIKKALEEIISKRKTKYDPDVVDACARLFYDKNFSLESDLPEENVKGYLRRSA